ncbi:unnamed protein product [Clonostachys solani]|uniref:Uncharacterized protein n=1 Tax=Clonostachys solani TaxID=160281 RepID=A0A9N9Z797_9HYPO|nr:unnamed protein product [Clonostachys solani]
MDLKAVFVQNKLTISASEDPEHVAQDLEMYQIPDPLMGALGILAALAVDMKAVFVQNKLSISASEDPERVAQDLEMYQVPDPVSFADGVRPLNANLFAYRSGSRDVPDPRPHLWGMFRGLSNA